MDFAYQPAHDCAWLRHELRPPQGLRRGLHGVLARENGELAVYVVCEPASHYYQVMARSKWMPVLIGERI